MRCEVYAITRSAAFSPGFFSVSSSRTSASARFGWLGPWRAPVTILLLLLFLLLLHLFILRIVCKRQWRSQRAQYDDDRLCDQPHFLLYFPSQSCFPEQSHRSESRWSGVPRAGQASAWRSWAGAVMQRQRCPALPAGRHRLRHGAHVKHGHV